MELSGVEFFTVLVIVSSLLNFKSLLPSFSTHLFFSVFVVIFLVFHDYSGLGGGRIHWCGLFPWDHGNFKLLYPMTVDQDEGQFQIQLCEKLGTRLNKERKRLGLLPEDSVKLSPCSVPRQNMHLNFCRHLGSFTTRDHTFKAVQTACFTIYFLWHDAHIIIKSDIVLFHEDISSLISLHLDETKLAFALNAFLRVSRALFLF